MRLIHILSSLSLLFSVACSSTEQSYCNKLIQCEAGNDKDRDACVQGWLSRSRIAADYGCGEAFSNYILCLDTNGTCNMSMFTSSCSANRDALDACESAASVRGNRHFLIQQ